MQIPECITTVVPAPVAVCLLAGHPEGTTDETTLNVTLNSMATKFIQIQCFQKVSA